MPSSRPDLVNSDPAIFARYMQLMAQDFIQFEIFYTDGSSVYGTELLHWVNAPNTGVQVVYWQTTNQSIIQICALDIYRGKQGEWMEDVDFDALLESTVTLTQVR